MPMRRTDVKLTRLRIGHTRFTHRHLLLGEDAPECSSCKQVKQIPPTNLTGRNSFVGVASKITRKEFNILLSFRKKRLDLILCSIGVREKGNPSLEFPVSRRISLHTSANLEYFRLLKSSGGPPVDRDLPNVLPPQTPRAAVLKLSTTAVLFYESECIAYPKDFEHPHPRLNILDQNTSSCPISSLGT
ncbi:hypothetical protein TNCV_2128831 [Trichonephila clavipes]|nr:hypothetical protein TNCV_2128831 [Trichonephila clavipes]